LERPAGAHCKKSGAIQRRQVGRFSGAYIQALIRKIKRRYGSDYYAYAWTCEDSTEHGKQGKHYHLALFLNGNKYRSDYTIMGEILRWWTERTTLSGNIPRYDKSKGDRNTVGLLRRADTKKFEDVIYGLSYLCKTSQKHGSSERLFSISHKT
ncbi:YagK/YfjJ domain-containing protein, partial [Pseudaeromonas pectinilytica]